MVNYLSAFIFGIIQGATEFLPVSSSGHLNIFQSLFNLKPSLDFDIFLHLATLLSVIVFFRQKLKFFFINLPQIILASLPAAIIALVFGSQIEQLFSDLSYLPFFFLITSIILFSTKFIKVTDKPVSYVINTHAHLDHSFGNGGFAGQNAAIIAHADCRDEMARKGLPHRLTGKQRLSILTSIASAVGAALAAFYAIISR